MKNIRNIPVKRKIVFIFLIFLFILFILFAISFFYAIFSHSMGENQEGISGYFCEIVFRIFISLVIFIVLAINYFIKEKPRSIIIWWICAIVAFFGVFYLIRAWIFDFSYINAPKVVKLNYITFEQDNIYEYSIVYKLIGYTEKGDTEIFNINSETYDLEKEKWKDDEFVSAYVQYLPHTGVLMNLKTFKENK